MIEKILAVFFLLFLCVPLVVGQSFTTDELYSREWGNKVWVVTSNAGGTTQTALMTYAQVFRCSNAITVNVVGIRIGAILGSFTNYPLRIGLMNVNASGFLTTWCGAGADARATWRPTASTWNNITLNQTASLSDNTTYALVIQDYNGTGSFSATRYFTYYYIQSPDVGYLDVRGINGSYESWDIFETKTSAAVYSRQYNLFGWYIRDSTRSGYEADAWQGISYASRQNNNVYLNRPVNQSFYVYTSMVVDRLSIKSYNNGLGAYHNDTLHVFLYGPSNTLVWSGAVGDSNHHAGGTNAWLDYDMSPLTLSVGRYWMIVWSKCGTTTSSYSIMKMSLADVAGNQHENLTFQGAVYCLKTSTNNGTAWTKDKTSDLAFKFRVRPTLTTYTNAVNSTVTGQTQQTVTGVNFWANATGPGKILVLNSLNSYFSGTLQGRYNSSTNKMVSWANITGADLLSRKKIVNATGTHDSRYNATTNHWMSWANYTGTGGGSGTVYVPLKGSSSDSLSVMFLLGGFCSMPFGVLVWKRRRKKT